MDVKDIKAQVLDVKAQMEKGLRSAKYAAKYGVGFTVPNPIVRKSKEESIDVLMKRFYTMPLPKGGGVVHGRGTNFDDDEGDDEEGDDDVDDLASIGSSHHSTASASGAGLVSGAGGGRPGSGAFSPAPAGTGAASPAGFRSGFGSPVRTFSQGGLSSVSDAREHGGAATPTSTSTSKKKGGDDEDDKEGEEEGEGEEDDDGFGALNISADRLPTDDTALSRFLKRAIANNGEAAQISGLKSSLEGALSAMQMPRSEEEILADLDKRFYEPEFDPTRAVLESFPSEAAEFNLWVEKQLSEKDVAKEHVMAQLATRVEANYHALIEGMKNVQEVDLDLTQAGVQCVGSRQKLAIAAHGIRDPLLRILHKRIRRENLQRVANVVKGAHGVLALVKQAKAAAAGGRLDRAVGAATEARLAIDGELLKNVGMMDGVGTALDKLLPELRLDVDKSLRRLCSGKLGAAPQAGGFAAADYAWILRAYLTLDDHGIRLNSKPRGAVSASTLYEPTGEVEDSLAVGIVPIAPTVDRGGIPGLSERIQRFTAMELDYCIKAAVIHAILAAPKSPASASPTATAATAAAAAAMAGTTKIISGALRSTSPAPGATATPQPQAQTTPVAGGSTPASPVAAPPTPAGPEVVKDVHGRIIAFKGRRLNGWPVPELIRMLPAGASQGVLAKLAEGVAEALHRFYCITQWHRSPFDPQNEDPAFLHRPGALSKQKSELAGGLSDDEGDEGEEEEDGEGGVSPSKRKGGKKRGVEEEDGSDDEEEEEEEGGDEGFFDAPAEDKQVDAAEKARAAQERKERLERARLATVARGLKQARKQLWAPVEKAVVALLKEAKEEVSMEGMVQTVATCELLIALGEEFGRNESAALRALLHDKAMALLEKTHQECFAGVKQMLERETWYHVPISVEDLGGMAGVIGNHTRGLAWPAMNGWGILVKDRILHNATKAAAAASPSSPMALASPGAAIASPTPAAAAPLTILAHFVSKGNPFAAAPKALGALAPASTSNSSNALLVFDASTITAPPAPVPSTTSSSNSSNAPLPSPGGVSASGGASSTSSSQQQAALPKPPATWAITQAALNGLARFAGRYLQLMRLCPSLALEAYTALLQLLDLYVYAVGAFFVPEPSLRLFLSGGAGQLNLEGSVVEELNWANQEVYVPLPCELEGELAALRAYLNAVREDLVDADDHWEALAAEAASKLKKLGADTAKKLGAFAAGQAALNNMMGAMAGTTSGGGGGGGGGNGGAGRTSPQPAAATGSASGASRGPSPATLPPPIVTAGLVRSAGPSPTPAEDGGESDSESESGEEGGEGKKAGGARGAARNKRLVKRVKVQAPAHVAEALEDPDALYGLSQRAVAVESCAFLLELLRHLQPHALALLPRRAPLAHGSRGACDAYLDSTVAEAVAQLRTLVLRAAAPKLVGAAGVVAAVEAQAWGAAGQGSPGRIREEANAYTEAVCGQCRALWARVGGEQAALAGGLDSTYIPPQCQLPIWTEACQAAMAALLEGFARVEQCAPEGRALMSMDLQAVQAGLDAVRKARPGRGRVHVDNYVKAFYYGEADLLAWAAQNHKSHFFRHLAGLLACSGAGQRLPKKKLRERILQLEAYYHPHPAEEREQQGGHAHAHAHAGAEAPRSGGGSSGGGAGAAGGRSPTVGFASAAASASSFMSGMRSAAAKAAEEFKI